MIVDILLLVFGLLVLVFGGEFLVKGAVGLAKAVKISPLVIGMTVVAFGTSAPELIVSITTALEGNSGIAVGNVIGSNIANIALVLGATVLILPITVDRQTKVVDLPVMMLATGLFFWVAYDGKIEFYEGFMLFLTLLAYLGYMAIQTVRRRKERLANELKKVSDDEPFGLDEYKDEPFWKSISFLLLGFIGLYFGAEWFIEGAKGIAEYFLSNNPDKDIIIGVTVVALGTSTPELVASTVAAYRKQTDLSIGNLIGSNIFNIFAVVGITSMVRPIEVSQNAMDFDMWWMVGVALLMCFSIFTGGMIRRWEGVVMLLTYVAYIAAILIRIQGAA